MRLLALALTLAASFGAAAVEQISVLALFKNKAMVEIDGKQRLLKQGVPSPEGVTLIKATVRSAILDVEGNRAEYTLGQRISTRYAKAAKGARTRILPTANGMYFTRGYINGMAVQFLIDTGATFIAMNRNEAKRLGLDYIRDGTEGRASTASGVVRSYNLTLKRVRVGEIELRNVKAAVVDGDFPREILLGNSFLNRLEMVREGRMLELRKRAY